MSVMGSRAAGGEGATRTHMSSHSVAFEATAYTISPLPLAASRGIRADPGSLRFGERASRGEVANFDGGVGQPPPTRRQRERERPRARERRPGRPLDVSGAPRDDERNSVAV